MSSLRNFGISFIIALLVLAGLAYYALGVVATLFENEETSAMEGQRQEVQKYEGEEIGEDIEKGIKTGRSFNILIIGTDRDDQIFDYSIPETEKPVVQKRVRATTLLFVRFDRDKRALRFCSVPASTVVNVDFVDMELGTAYGYKGGEYVKDKVSGLLSMNIDFYFEFSGRDFVTKGPKTAFTAPAELSVPSYKGLSAANYIKGQYLAGAALYTYLHYDNYPIERIEERNTIIREFFMQTMLKFTNSNPQKYYEQLSFCKTDMTLQDVAELIEVLNILPLFVGQETDATTVTVIDLYRMGSFLKDGSFLPDKDAIKKATEKYK